MAQPGLSPAERYRHWEEFERARGNAVRADRLAAFARQAERLDREKGGTDDDPPPAGRGEGCRKRLLFGLVILGAVVHGVREWMA